VKSWSTAVIISILLSAPGAAQLHHGWVASGVLLSYRTGDELNCPTGAGLGLDIERRWGSAVSVGVGAGVRLADAYVCTLALKTRFVDGQWLGEFDHLSLIGAPSMNLSLGSGFNAGDIDVGLRFRGGTILGRTNGPGEERMLMSFNQGEVTVSGGRMGIILRIGAIRSPINLVLGREVIDREWHWRRITELGLLFAW
jgi:hypothetical protein